MQDKSKDIYQGKNCIYPKNENNEDIIKKFFIYVQMTENGILFKRKLVALVLSYAHKVNYMESSEKSSHSFMNVNFE